jgi:hypothetical protein
MEYRISKLREYLFTILDTMLNSTDYQINANMLANDINNYSLDKIPTSSTVEKWINGTEIHRDVYSFRSRCAYSQDTINNLKNVGFFETFEKIIKSNNNKGILPNIEGIQSIECLNCASMVSTETNTAEFDIQIQITYKEV